MCSILKIKIFIGLKTKYWRTCKYRVIYLFIYLFIRHFECHLRNDQWPTQHCPCSVKIKIHRRIEKNSFQFLFEKPGFGNKSNVNWQAVPRSWCSDGERPLCMMRPVSNAEKPDRVSQVSGERRILGCWLRE